MKDDLKRCRPIASIIIPIVLMTIFTIIVIILAGWHTNAREKIDDSPIVTLSLTNNTDVPDKVVNPPINNKTDVSNDDSYADETVYVFKENKHISVNDFILIDESVTEQVTESPAKPETNELILNINEAENVISIPETFTAFSTFTSLKGNEHELPLREELQYHTYLMAEKYNVPYKIILAIMGVETTWREDIGIVNGYVGLGCLNEKYHAKSFAEQGINIYTPEGNIEAICILIRKSLDNFDGNIHFALMAYNKGTNGARQLIENGQYTTKYSEKVIWFAESFK